MLPGKGWSSWWRSLLGAGLCLLAGCAAGRSQLEQALLADRDPAAHGTDLAARYAVHCPDVLSVQVAGRPEWSGLRRVGPDGRIALDDAVGVRVDGLAAPEVARSLAELAGLPPGSVSVRVAEFNSRQLFLFGQVSGQERAVPYRGPETVLDLLQHVGGITPGAALGEIQVLRPHVADGKAPEIFHVNLAAIVLQHDQETNVLLEPFDQVYVGQTRKSSFACCLPPWMQPLYKTLCGMRRR
jgi:protein involved in polysaccharide export with SLBB domain